MDTNHLYCYTADAAQVPHILLLDELPMERVETSAEQIDDEVIPIALLALRPKRGHALAALQRRIKGPFIAVGGAGLIKRLHLDSGHLSCVDMLRREDSAYT